MEENSNETHGSKQRDREKPAENIFASQRQLFESRSAHFSKQLGLIEVRSRCRHKKQKTPEFVRNRTKATSLRMFCSAFGVHLIALSPFTSDNRPSTATFGGTSWQRFCEQCVASRHAEQTWTALQPIEAANARCFWVGSSLNPVHTTTSRCEPFGVNPSAITAFTLARPNHTRAQSSPKYCQCE